MRRFSRSPPPTRFFDDRRRGDSAPRYDERRRTPPSQRPSPLKKGGDDNEKKSDTGAEDTKKKDVISPESKSKSLPPKSRSLPRGVDRNGGREDGGKKVVPKETPEEREERLFQAKIRNMPSPEREKLLARRAKFTSSSSSELGSGSKPKVISLKGLSETNKKPEESEKADPDMVGEISLDVGDTLDMFDEPGSNNGGVPQSAGVRGDRAGQKKPLAERIERPGVRRDMREKLQNKKGNIVFSNVSLFFHSISKKSWQNVIKCFQG